LSIACRKKHEWGLYEEPTETESEGGKKRTRDLAEEEVEREKIKKLREEMANGVNPFAVGRTFIPLMTECPAYFLLIHFILIPSALHKSIAKNQSYERKQI